MNLISANLANVNTSGFKKGKVTFTDLVMRDAGALQPAFSDDGGLNAGLLAAIPRLGAGVGAAGVSKVFDVGDLKQTGSAFDIAIQGDGFLALFGAPVPQPDHHVRAVHAGLDLLELVEQFRRHQRAVVGEQP